MNKNELVTLTAEFINEKVREELSYTRFETTFVVDVNKFLEDLIETESILNEQGRDKMFQDVLEEIKIGYAPMCYECDDYDMFVSVENGEITFTKEDEMKN